MADLPQFPQSFPEQTKPIWRVFGGVKAVHYLQTIDGRHVACFAWLYRSENGEIRGECPHYVFVREERHGRTPQVA